MDPLMEGGLVLSEGEKNNGRKETKEITCEANAHKMVIDKA